jgi:thiol-disulfide isomerase/thioredoxin
LQANPGRKRLSELDVTIADPARTMLVTSTGELMKLTRLAFALLASTLLASIASAQTLKVGDPAPALQQGKYVQGEPVTSFQPGMVYVVEFWATWCGPCIRAIPHVNDLQKKYEGKVVVIGQNVWEDDVSKVEPFVKRMGDKMTYRVALDSKPGAEGGMARTWMQAAGQNGIPAAFIIGGDGKIAWIGHPMQMDQPLEAAVKAASSMRK